MGSRKTFAFRCFILLLLTISQTASANGWQKVFGCGDALVVDKMVWNHNNGYSTTRQLVLRESKAIEYFLQNRAIEPEMINARGEFIYGGIEANNHDGIRFQSRCNPDTNICYVIRQMGQTTYRLEAWRTAFSNHGPQGLVADWVFYNCALYNNY